ncbi:MAG TPA: hypothetical protein VN374_06050 [Desulfitobacteriaceae bacterium]|nr:hypothetical protein [Desulfitobacteriaceae bacterium]
MRIGFNPKNCNIKTDAPGISIDRGFLAHFQVSAANAAAASATGVMAAANLGASTQTKTTGITNPAVPRALRIAGNVSGLTTKVNVKGTNFAGEAISEELTLNGTANVDGAKAFKTITEIDLPAQTHTPAEQTEIQEYTHKADAGGTITVTVTAAGMNGSPKAVALEVETDDTAIEVATKVVAALNADEDVSAKFVASNEDGTSATVTLTALAPAANDATLAMAFVDTDTTGVTAGVSTDGTAGVPYDKVSVGWCDKLGLPYKLAQNTVLATYLDNTKETNPPTVTVSATDLESNTIDLDSALNGKVVDAYLLV